LRLSKDDFGRAAKFYRKRRTIFASFAHAKNERLSAINHAHTTAALRSLATSYGVDAAAVDLSAAE